MTVLPGDGFRIIPGAAHRVEGHPPVAVGLLSPEKAGGRVEKVPVTEGAGIVFRCNLLVSQGLGHPGDAPVIIAEFQRLGHGFRRIVRRDIAIGVVPAGGRIQVGGCHHRGEGFFPVEGTDPPQPGIGDDGCAVVADHAVHIHAAQGPEGQFAVASVHPEEALRLVADHFRIQKDHQRVPAPEGVPERKGGIEGTLPGIAEKIRGNQGMIQGRIEIGPLGGRPALDRYLRKLPFPKGFGFFADAVEVSLRSLRHAVLPGRKGIRRRKPHRHGQLLRSGRKGKHIPVLSIGLTGSEGHGECRREEHPAVPGPSDHVPAAFDDPVGNDVQADPVRMGAADVIPKVHP